MYELLFAGGDAPEEITTDKGLMYHQDGYFINEKGEITMRPTQDWVLVKSDQYDVEREEGSVIVVESMPKVLEGEVLAVNENSELSVGDRVMYPREKRNITEAGDEFLVREKEILMVV